MALGERERDRAGDALAGEREGERERRAGEAPAVAPPVEETGERERTGDRERRAGERRGELPLAAGLLERRGEGVRRPISQEGINYEFFLQIEVGEQQFTG